MKMLMTTLLLFALSAVLMGRSLADGFYEMTIDPTVKSRTHKGFRIGPKKKFKIKEVWLNATDNLNEYFQLTVVLPYQKALARQRQALLVNNNTYIQFGGGSNPQHNSSSLSFRVKGSKHAEDIAKYFSIQPRYRQHPGYRFAVTFTPDKETFRPGEEIWVTLKIKNVGTKATVFQKGGRNRAPRDNQYVFSGEFNSKPIIDIGSSNNHGGRSIKQTIKPGETFKDRVNLTKWFRFDKKGWYKILGSYYMAFHDPKDKTYRISWEDYVSGEFYFNVQ